MTVQWITDGTVGTPQVGLGLSDAELLQRCAQMNMGDPNAAEVLQTCKAQVEAVKAEANNYLGQARTVKAQAQDIANEIDALAGVARQSATAGDCSAASSVFSDLESKLVNQLQPLGPKVDAMQNEVAGLLPDAFYDDHVSWVHGEVGSINSFVQGVLEQTDNTVGNTRLAVNACAGPGPVTPPPKPTAKKKKSKVGWGLALLAVTAIVGIVKGTG